MADHDLWRELGQQLRVDAVRASAKAGSGHPTSSMSAADLAAVLLAEHFRYDFDDPKSPANDRLIFSKGHASPLVYGLFRAAGVLSEEEFGTYRQFGSRLEGHPTPALPWVDVATGSLGQGLPIGVGDGARRQAARPAAVPRLGDLRRQRDGRGLDVGGDRARRVLRARQPDRDHRRQPARPARRDDARLGPLLRTRDRLARVRLARDRDRRPRRRADRRRVPRGRVDDGQADRGRREDDQGQGLLEGREQERLAREGDRRGGGRGARRHPQHRRSTCASRRPAERASLRAGRRSSGRATRSGSKVATRKAYGEALAALGGERGDVVALDGEVSNSTYSEIFRDAHPERFFEMYIAEQQMVAAAVGMQVLGWKPFASTFAAFMSRAYDFVRMARSRARSSSSAARTRASRSARTGRRRWRSRTSPAFRAVNGSTVLYPCDGNQTAKLVRAMADLDGISFLRTTRADTPVIYEPDEEFPVGGSRRRARRTTTTSRSSRRDHAARGARRRRRARGEEISARVIDSTRSSRSTRETLRAAAPDADRHRRGPLARGRARRGGALGARRRRGRAARGQARRA